MVRDTSSRFAILLVALLPSCMLAGPAEAPTGDAARERTFRDGIRALEQAEFESASQRLATVAAICPVDGVGRRAMLLLAAAELDPRNGAGRVDVAAELTAFQLARPSTSEPWAASLAREIHVIALDYGATGVAATEIPGPGVLWTRYFEGRAQADDRAAARTPAGEELVADDAEEADDGDAAGVAGQPVATEPRGGPLCDVPAADSRITMPELTRRPVVAGGEPDQGAPARPAPAADPADVRALTAEVNRLRAQLAATEQELDRIRRTLRP